MCVCVNACACECENVWGHRYLDMYTYVCGHLFVHARAKFYTYTLMSQIYTRTARAIYTHA